MPENKNTIQPDEKGIVNVSWDARSGNELHSFEYSLNTNTGEVSLREYGRDYMDERFLLTETTCQVKEREVPIGEDGHAKLPMNKDNYVYKEYEKPEIGHEREENMRNFTETYYENGKATHSLDVYLYNNGQKEVTIQKFDDKDRIEHMEMKTTDKDGKEIYYGSVDHFYNEKGIDHSISIYRDNPGGPNSPAKVTVETYYGQEGEKQGKAISFDITIENKDGSREETHESVPHIQQEYILERYEEYGDRAVNSSDVYNDRLEYGMDKDNLPYIDKDVGDVHRTLFDSDGNKVYEYQREFNPENENVSISHKWFDEKGEVDHSLDCNIVHGSVIEHDGGFTYSVDIEEAHLIIKDKDEIVVNRFEPAFNALTYPFYSLEEIKTNLEEPIKSEIEMARDVAHTQTFDKDGKVIYEYERRWETPDYGESSNYGMAPSLTIEHKWNDPESGQSIGVVYHGDGNQDYNPDSRETFTWSADLYVNGQVFYEKELIYGRADSNIARDLSNDSAARIASREFVRDVINDIDRRENPEYYRDEEEREDNYSDHDYDNPDYDNSPDYDDGPETPDENPEMPGGRF